MAKIVFRGKTYKSVFDMPDDVRQDYQKNKAPKNTGMSSGSFSTNLDNIPSIVRGVYERAQQNFDNVSSSSTVDNLPKAVDMYSRKPPQRSDESIYEPAPPLVTSSQNTIEPDTGIRRLVMSLLAVALLAGAVAAMVYFGV